MMLQGGLSDSSSCSILVSIGTSSEGSATAQALYLCQELQRCNRDLVHSVASCVCSGYRLGYLYCCNIILHLIVVEALA